MCSYTEALSLPVWAGSCTVVHGGGRHRVLANRSLAYSHAGRWLDALSDAEAAVAAAPSWDKGHWRRGAALSALKRTPAAVEAYHRCWQLNNGDALRIRIFVHALICMCRNISRPRTFAKHLDIHCLYKKEGQERRDVDDEWWQESDFPLQWKGNALYKDTKAHIMLAEGRE